MKKNHALARLGGLLLVSYTLLAVTAAAAGSPGTESDPLVTLSYLNDTFMAQLLGRVDEKLAARDRELADRLDRQIQQDTQSLAEQYGSAQSSSAADTFTVVTLSYGQTLYGGIGCEVMLRVGSADCIAASSPGLIDETDGAVLGGGGALAPNHVYMMTIEGRGVQASAQTTKLLVRGAYTLQG